MKFYERLEGLFNRIEQSQGISRSQIIMRTGLDPAQYRAYKRENRLPSDEMLKKLSSCSEFNIRLENLQAWKALDEYSQRSLLRAFQIILQEKK
jgi:transcriptional regulator with XRE-family HTH domain